MVSVLPIRYLRDEVLEDLPALSRNQWLGESHCKNACQKENENFNHAVFAFAFFSRRQDRELFGAISRGLLQPLKIPATSTVFSYKTSDSYFTRHYGT
jgi:hypothetical protein